MTDIVDVATRSRMMSRIQRKNTKPEIAVRKGLHRLGLRFRLNGSSLPGRPDLVLSKHRAVVFVHGCFWHAHACDAFHLPASNTTFWTEKLQKNIDRDRKCVDELRSLGWRIIVIWECASKISTVGASSELFQMAYDWIVNYDSPYLEIYKETKNGLCKCITTTRAL